MGLTGHPQAGRLDVLEDAAMSLSFTYRRVQGATDTLAGAEPDSIRYGTPGDDHYTGSGDFDMSQGGDDTLRLKGNGDNMIYFGAAFTGADRVFAGKGFDTVTLDGDYSDGIEVGAKSLQFIEQLVLEGGSYVMSGYLNFDDGNGARIDATALSASQSLKLDVSSLGKLFVLAGAGDDIIHAAVNGHDSYLFGFDGDDTLVGGSGASLMAGVGGADTIVMSNSGDVAQYFASDSTAKVFDTIKNFTASGGRIELSFDSDTTTVANEHDFHLGRTAERVGDILSHYDAGKDETIVKVFTDHDNKPDFLLHLTGDVPLTPADFIFG